MGSVELNLSALEERYGRLRARDPRRQARMLASIEEHGQRDPIIVVAEGEGRFVVIDGHARVRALKRLRRDVVKALVLDMEPALKYRYQKQNFQCIITRRSCVGKPLRAAGAEDSP